MNRQTFTFVAAAAIGLALAIAPRFMFAWCEFTEFGYLGRIPAAVVVLVEIATAAVLGVVGAILRLRGRPSGTTSLASGLGLGLGVAVSFLIKIPTC